MRELNTVTPHRIVLVLILLTLWTKNPEQCLPLGIDRVNVNRLLSHERVYFVDADLSRYKGKLRPDSSTRCTHKKCTEPRKSLPRLQTAFRCCVYTLWQIYIIFN